MGFEEERATGQAKTLLRRATADTIDPEWAPAEVERVVTRNYEDGTVMMTVDVHPELGYLIEAPGHGRFLVAADGSLVKCAPEPGPEWRWHRPLIAQALPMAAALSGFEVLHASGVEIDGRTFAIVGHSGAGKTSLALHLVDQGASLIADDVVALSPGEPPLAHPGVRFANFAEEQLTSIALDRRERLGPVVGRSEKVHVLVEPMAGSAAPLGAIYFIDRMKPVPDVHFARLQPLDLRLLLSATFMPHVSAPRRLAAQLDICRQIVERVPAFHLFAPPTMTADVLASAVSDHAIALERT